MTPKEFVQLFYNEKTDYLNACFDENGGVFASKKIKELKLSGEQTKLLKEIIDLILTDTYYSILLGLDGCANVGGRQISYKLYDEDGNSLTDCGEIQGEAWEFFHSDNE